MKKIVMLVAAMAIVVLSGCATAVPRGLISSNMTLPIQATGNMKGTKVGIAKCQSIMGFVASGDASIEAAMRKGGITKVSHVDWKVESEIPLGIKTVYTTTVYGD